MKKINFPFYTPAQIYRREKIINDLRNSTDYQIYLKRLNYNPCRYAKAGYKPPLPRFYHIKRAINDTAKLLKELFWD